MLKKCLLPASFAIALACASPAAAESTVPVLFDPNGPTGGTSYLTISALDWNAGNAIAVGVSATSPVGTTFQLYYQANLSVSNDVNGNGNYLNCSLTGGCITLVLGFEEKITSSTFDPTTGAGLFNFAFVSGGNNFFDIFAQDTSGNNLSGACFVCPNAASLFTNIMSGSILPDNYVSNFTATASAPVALDQNLTNNYLGVNTITGTGAVHLTASVTTFNPLYFQGLGGSLIQFAFADTDTALPFRSIDPSACFYATTSTGGLTPVCTNGAGFFINPFTGVGSVGGVNGISTSNLMFQADAISSFTASTAAVPEPATLTLLGLGLLGTAQIRRRQNKNKNKK